MAVLSHSCLPSFTCLSFTVFWTLKISIAYHKKKKKAIGEYMYLMSLLFSVLHSCCHNTKGATVTVPATPTSFCTPCCFALLLMSAQLMLPQDCYIKAMNTLHLQIRNPKPIWFYFLPAFMVLLWKKLPFAQSHFVPDYLWSFTEGKELPYKIPTKQITSYSLIPPQYS